jgi:hypothetical protein
MPVAYRGTTHENVTLMEIRLAAEPKIEVDPLNGRSLTAAP